jgi:hypothetical protein
LPRIRAENEAFEAVPFSRDTCVEGVVMLWIIIPVAVFAVGCVIAFLFGPTIRSLFGPDFEPASKDDASVENAITSSRRRRSVTPAPDS